MGTSGKPELTAGMGGEKTNPLVRSTGQVPPEAWGLILRSMLFTDEGGVHLDCGFDGDNPKRSGLVGWID
ncbi:hypothetical protein D9M70_460900 [compost metagenome]